MILNATGFYHPAGVDLLPRVSGGVAALNHRLIPMKPPASNQPTANAGKSLFD
jgi:hypothetical protein